MELVEGPTLAERMRAGVIPLAEALPSPITVVLNWQAGLKK